MLYASSISFLCPCSNLFKCVLGELVLLHNNEKFEIVETHNCRTLSLEPKIATERALRVVWQPYGLSVD